MSILADENLPELLKKFKDRTTPDELRQFSLNDRQSLLTLLPKLSEKRILPEHSALIAEYAGAFSNKRLADLFEAHINGEEANDLIKVAEPSGHVARLAEQRVQEEARGAQPNGR